MGETSKTTLTAVSWSSRVFAWLAKLGKGLAVLVDFIGKIIICSFSFLNIRLCIVKMGSMVANKGGFIGVILTVIVAVQVFGRFAGWIGAAKFLNSYVAVTVALKIKIKEED